jgi:hypothetical protein
MNETPSHPQNVVSSMISRYSDAYAVARTIDDFGTAIKYIGLAGGSLIAFAAIASTTMSSFVMPPELGNMRFVAALMAGAAGTVVAAFVAGVCFLLGTLTAAQGQILQATLDTAMNSSRLLSDEDRTRVLSMPVQATVRPIPAQGPIPVDRISVREGAHGSV